MLKYKKIEFVWVILLHAIVPSWLTSPGQKELKLAHALPVEEVPEDIAGLKIRVMQSLTAVQMIRAMSGTATPISWDELYTALQGGVVDRAENNPPGLFSSRHYGVCKYCSLNEHTTIPDVLVIGEKGTEVTYPNNEPFIQKVQPLLESNQIHPVIYSYIKQIQNVK